MDKYSKQYIASLGVRLAQKILSSDVGSVDEACYFIIRSVHRLVPSPMRIYLRNDYNEFEEKYYILDLGVQVGDDSLPIYQLDPELLKKLTAIQHENPGQTIISVPLRHKDQLIGFIEITRESPLSDEVLMALGAYGNSVSLGLYIIKEKDKSKRRRDLHSRIMKILIDLRAKDNIEKLVITFVNEVSRYFLYDRTCVFIFDEHGQIIYHYGAKSRGNPLTISHTHKMPTLDNSPQAFFDISGWWLPIRAKNQVIGCVLVDNIYTLSKINENQLSALEELCNFVGIIIENMRLFESIERLGRVDHLTGIYNRRVGIYYINQLIKESDKKNLSFALIFTDLTGLKLTNDTHGHSLGDQMIKDFVGCINEVVRPRDIVSRMGGDEFLIIFPDCNMEGAEAAWQRIEARMQAYNKATDKTYRLSASHGCVVYEPHSGVSANRLLAIADKRMYREKRPRASLPI